MNTRDEAARHLIATPAAPMPETDGDLSAATCDAWTLFFQQALVLADKVRQRRAARAEQTAQAQNSLAQ